MPPLASAASEAKKHAAPPYSRNLTAASPPNFIIGTYRNCGSIGNPEYGRSRYSRMRPSASHRRGTASWYTHSSQLAGYWNAPIDRKIRGTRTIRIANGIRF